MGTSGGGEGGRVGDRPLLRCYLFDPEARMRIAIFLGVVLATGASRAVAAEWISPDGKLAIDAPTSHGFKAEVNPTAPFIAQWSSRDSKTTIAFLSMPNPRNEAMEQRGLEEGSIQETGGSILSSTRREISGISVYTIACRASKSGIQFYYLQEILAFNGSAYKLMACSPSDVSQDATVNQIFQSLRILDPAPKPPQGRLDTHAISKRLGGWGLVILVIAVVALVVRKASGRGKSQVGPRS